MYYKEIFLILSLLFEWIACIYHLCGENTVPMFSIATFSIVEDSFQLYPAIPPPSQVPQHGQKLQIRHSHTLLTQKHHHTSHRLHCWCIHYNDYLFWRNRLIVLSLSYSIPSLPQDVLCSNTHSLICLCSWLFLPKCNSSHALFFQTISICHDQL